MARSMKRPSSWDIARTVGKYGGRYLAKRAKRAGLYAAGKALSHAWPKSAKQKRYMQRVHLGTRGRRFRRGRPAKPMKMARYGSLSQRETGSTVTDASLVAIGHSTLPLYESLFAAVRGIWRNLYLNCGFQISAWEEPPA